MLRRIRRRSTSRWPWVVIARWGAGAKRLAAHPGHAARFVALTVSDLTDRSRALALPDPDVRGDVTKHSAQNVAHFRQRRQGPPGGFVHVQSPVHLDHDGRHAA